MSDQVHLKGLRIIYPSLFTTALFKGKDTGKFSLTLLLPKSEKEVKKNIDKLIADTRASVKYKISDDCLCIKDGDDRDDLDKNPYYANHWIIKTGKTAKAKNSPMIQRPRMKSAQGNVITINNDGKPIAIDSSGNVSDEVITSDYFYPGCFVYAIVDFWAYDGGNGGDKAVLSNLLAVKFVKHGERLKGGNSSIEDFDENFEMPDDDL